MQSVLSTEPSLATLWLIYGSIGVAGFLVCRFRFWPVYLILPFVLLLSIPLLMELYDPITGRAIREESRMYFMEAHVTLLIAFCGPFLGAWRRLRE